MWFAGILDRKQETRSGLTWSRLPALRVFLGCRSFGDVYPKPWTRTLKLSSLKPAILKTVNPNLGT